MRGKKKRRRRRRKNHKKLLFMAGGILILLLICAGTLFWASFERIDLNEEAVVAFSGFDTQGSVSVDVAPKEGYEEFYRTVNASVSQNGTFCNGDEAVVHFSYDEKLAKELRLRVRALDKVVAVEGLPTAKKVSLEELFGGLQMNYTGIAPQITVEMSNISTDPFFGKISFVIEEPKEFYDEGDLLKVRAVFDEEEAFNRNYDVEKGENGYEKTITVTGVDTYLQDGSELNEEQVMELSDAGKELLGDANDYGLRIFSEANLMPIWVNNKLTFKWTNPRLLSMYFHSLKEEAESKGMHRNDIECVYMATLSQADGVSCQAEVVVRFTDLVKRADGSFDLSIGTGEIISASYRNSNIKQLLTNDDYYVTEKLDLM